MSTVVEYGPGATKAAGKGYWTEAETRLDLKGIDWPESQTVAELDLYVKGGRAVSIELTKGDIRALRAQLLDILRQS